MRKIDEKNAEDSGVNIQHPKMIRFNPGYRVYQIVYNKDKTRFFLISHSIKRESELSYGTGFLSQWMKYSGIEFTY